MRRIHSNFQKYKAKKDQLDLGDSERYNSNKNYLSKLDSSFSPNKLLKIKMRLQKPDKKI